MTTSFGSQFLHAIGPNVFSVANPLSHFNVYDVEEVARFCHFALAGMVGTQRIRKYKTVSVYLKVTS